MAAIGRAGPAKFWSSSVVPACFRDIMFGVLTTPARAYENTRWGSLQGSIPRAGSRDIWNLSRRNQACGHTAVVRSTTPPVTTARYHTFGAVDELPLSSTPLWVGLRQHGRRGSSAQRGVVGGWYYDRRRVHELCTQEQPDSTTP